MNLWWCRWCGGPTAVQGVICDQCWDNHMSDTRSWDKTIEQSQITLDMILDINALADYEAAKAAKEHEAWVEELDRHHRTHHRLRWVYRIAVAANIANLIYLFFF